ncbi:ATP-dependent Clp protease proteolytic subunit [compost metagenome]
MLINSIGGDVAEGFMIYTALRKYAVDNKATVTTYIKGRCYSIATVIFLAGDVRIANKFLSPFLHNAWIYTAGDSRQLQRDADDLEAVNHKIATFYAEHTDLTYEEVREIMNADTFIDPEECVRIRFATKIEEIVRPAAVRKILNKNRNMSVNKNDKGLFTKMKEFFNSLEGGASNLEVFTSTNTSIIFPDLEDGAEPKVGDKAEIDGKAAEGEYLMADERTFVFVAGELTEIKEKEEGGEGDGEGQTMEELQAENQRLKDELAAQASTKDAEIENLKNQNSAANANIAKLKGIFSAYAVETVDNKDKTPEGGDGDKNPLVASIDKMKAVKK